jgi:Fur family peroxide stress response transcriptional regulator
MIAPDEMRQQLKKTGLRVTPQRVAIMQALYESKEHPTAAKIFEGIRRQYPNLAMGTVYYTLEKLVESGMVTSLGMVGDDQVHYDGNTILHSHLACLSCQKIVDIQSPNLEDLTVELQSNTGFKLLGSCLMYYGICPDCQKSKMKINKLIGEI